MPPITIGGGDPSTAAKALARWDTTIHWLNREAVHKLWAWSTVPRLPTASMASQRPLNGIHPAAPNTSLGARRGCGGGAFAGRRAASRYVVGKSSSVSSPSSSAHHRHLDCPPEVGPGKNGAAAGDSEELRPRVMAPLHGCDVPGIQPQHRG